MKDIQLMRKTVHVWDTKEAQTILARLEKGMAEVLRDLGCPEEQIKFVRRGTPGNIHSAFTQYERGTEHWLPYDTALQHPLVEMFDASCLRIWSIKTEKLHDVSFRCSLTLDISLPAEEIQTLLNIGKITYDAGYTRPPQQQLACGI